MTCRESRFNPPRSSDVIPDRQLYLLPRLERRHPCIPSSATTLSNFIAPLTKVRTARASKRIPQITAPTTTRLLRLRPLLDRPNPLRTGRRLLQLIRNIIIPFQEERLLRLPHRCGGLRLLLLLHLCKATCTVLTCTPTLDWFAR